MTVEMKRSEEDSKDRFPVGMRVLAVDDDPTCLKVLDTLLRRCQYHVTTTNQAVAALKMLRENKNNFDIVISDVRMPDMDGFKLLELVGLEMDLPVIMLSAYGDTELVMQGVSHGACDYLLKPVRIEELKNIWQHVLRKKKCKTKEQKEACMQAKANRRIEEDAHHASLSDNVDQNRKLNRKRKDQDEYEDEDEDGEDEENESEETSNQKKARVVWSVELHQKFVAAVNQLGIDKAVPKKILDLMDVEGLTRENVASHLQKYRLYLKKTSNVDNQQANFAASFGKDSSYLHMASLEGHRDFCTLTAGPPGRLSNTALSSYFSGGVLGRLNNTPSGLNQNSNNAITPFGKLQPAIVFPSIQNSNLFQGIPTTLGIDRLQQNKCVSSSLNANSNNLAEPSSFLLSSSTYPNSRTNTGNSNNILNNPLLQGNSQNLQNTGGFSIQSSVSLNQEPFKMDPLGSSNFLDHSRYNGGFGSQTSVSLNPGATVSSNILDHGRTSESWTSTALFSKFLSSSLPISQPFNQDALTSNSSLNERKFPSGSKTPYNPVGFSSNSVISAPMGNLGADMQNQAGLIDNAVQSQKYSSLKQTWENNSSYNVCSKLGSLHSTNDSTRNMDMPTAGQFNGSSSAQHEGDNVSAMDPKMKTSGGYLDQLRPHGDFAQLGFDSLDDLMSTMVKREHHETMLMDGDFGFDGYSLGSYI